MQWEEAEPLDVENGKLKRLLAERHHVDPRKATTQR